MRQALIVACVFLAILAVRGRAIEPQAPPPLAVRIVPTRHHEKIGRTIELYQPSQHFDVVVTNVSGRPVRLWREWCSWGYFSLSFVVTGEDGKSVAVRKKPRGWFKNYPDATIVPPGDHLVFEVSFDDATWQDPPLPERGRSRTVKLKAEYAVGSDERSEELGVWTGRASSPEDRFTIWR